MSVDRRSSSRRLSRALLAALAIAAIAVPAAALTQRQFNSFVRGFNSEFMAAKETTVQTTGSDPARPEAIVVPALDVPSLICGFFGPGGAFKCLEGFREQCPGELTLVIADSGIYYCDVTCTGPVNGQCDCTVNYDSCVPQGG